MPIPFTFQAKDIESSNNVEAYLVDKFSKLDQYIGDEESSTQAEIEICKAVNGQHSGDIYRVEINLLLGGHLLRASAQEVDIFAAIDVAQEEIIREVNRYKGKRTTLFRRGARRMKDLMRGLRRT
jgi:ribosomal subunit interface protein